MKGPESMSELVRFWIGDEASARGPQPSRFGPRGVLTITLAEAQPSSQPPKRRWALRASNPLRNRRLQTHHHDEGATGTLPLFQAQHRCDRSPHTLKTPSTCSTTLAHHPQILPRNQEVIEGKGVRNQRGASWRGHVALKRKELEGLAGKRGAFSVFSGMTQLSYTKEVT